LPAWCKTCTQRNVEERRDIAGGVLILWGWLAEQEVPDVVVQQHLGGLTTLVRGEARGRTPSTEFSHDNIATRYETWGGYLKADQAYLLGAWRLIYVRQVDDCTAAQSLLLRPWNILCMRNTLNSLSIPSETGARSRSLRSRLIFLTLISMGFKVYGNIVSLGTNHNSGGTRHI
jgi:hypothetical protein